MSQLVETRLINDPFSDPGLLIDFRFGRRALLFDIGDLGAVSNRGLALVSVVFVSHRHMDHFAGFDRLLRLRLYRPGLLRVVGPPGLISGVAAKLAAYTWNLLDDSSIDFVIAAAEFADGRRGPSTLFRAREAFRPRPGEDDGGAAGLVLCDDDVRVEATTLDHATPCLAFALQESLRVNVWTEGLRQLGLGVGPWLNAAKTAVRRGDADETPIATGDRIMPLGELTRGALQVARGQRVAYVVDAVWSAANAERIVALAAGADHLYIEAAFLQRDAALAAARRHLTAHQAGTLARRAGVKRFTIFHHSARYRGRADLLRAEADAAYVAAGA